jgi:hypothetical protein
LSLGFSSPTDDFQRGAGVIGILVTLLALGALAVAVLMALPSITSSPSKGDPGSAAIASLPGGAPPSAGNDISVASTTACHANFAAAKTAVGVYQAETGALPTTIAEVQNLIRDPLSSDRFTITIDPRHPGELQVATPGHPPADGDINCAFAS